MASEKRPPKDGIWKFPSIEPTPCQSPNTAVPGQEAPPRREASPLCFLQLMLNYEQNASGDQTIIVGRHQDKQTDNSISE